MGGPKMFRAFQAAILIALASAGGGGSKCHSGESPWYDEFRPENTFHLTVQSDHKHILIHSDQGKFDDTTATIKGRSGAEYKITVTFSDKGKMTGRLDNECGVIVWEGVDQIWRRGTAPAPSPPTPPFPAGSCNECFNQTLCSGVGSVYGCTWCKSTDKVHQLCFDKAAAQKLDPSSWECDKNETYSNREYA